MLLKAQSVTKAFGPIKVLTDASLQINEGDSIGLIGVNGAGKSTFMNILLGADKPDTGELTRQTERIGYLPQFAETADAVTVRDVLGRPYGHVEHIRRRMRELDKEMASGNPDTDWNAVTTEYAKLEGQLSKSNHDDEKTQIDALETVGLSADFMDRRMDTLSGGERTKVMLSRVVVQAKDCDLLFLDEPTSHLDIETVEWLEDFLLDSRIACVVISHDRYFLDKMATRCVEISNGKTREYKGNYSAFIMKKMLDLDRMEKEYRKYVNQKKKQEEIAERLHKDQWFLTTHKTRQKLIEKMEEKEAPEKSREITVRIQAAPKSGKNVITGKGLSFSQGERVILSDVELDVHKGEKIGIFGANGQGKSTLIKGIVGEIPVGGDLWVAPGAKIGYFSQNHEGLNLDLTGRSGQTHAAAQRRGEGAGRPHGASAEGDQPADPGRTHQLSGHPCAPRGGGGPDGVRRHHNHRHPRQVLPGHRLHQGLRGEGRPCRHAQRDILVPQRKTEHHRDCHGRRRVPRAVAFHKLGHRQEVRQGGPCAGGSGGDEELRMGHLPGQDEEDRRAPAEEGGGGEARGLRGVNLPNG